MSIDVYRVREAFGWGGWQFAPARPCPCACDNAGPTACEKRYGSGCACKGHGCHCACTTPKATFAGDVWLVEAGHPRKEAMMGMYGGQRLASYDAAIPAPDVLLKKPQYKRLLSPPRSVRESVPA